MIATPLQISKYLNRVFTAYKAKEKRKVVIVVQQPPYIPPI